MLSFMAMLQNWFVENWGIHKLIENEYICPACFEEVEKYNIIKK
jgi:hypothetical protein